MALDRLADFAAADGDVGELSRLRASKLEMMAVLSRYRALFKDESPGDPAELARLAEKLGPDRSQGLVIDSRSLDGVAPRPALVPFAVEEDLDGSAARITLADVCADLRRSAPSGSLPAARGVPPRSDQLPDPRRRYGAVVPAIVNSNGRLSNTVTMAIQ